MRVAPPRSSTGQQRLLGDAIAGQLDARRQLVGFSPPVSRCTSMPSSRACSTSSSMLRSDGCGASATRLVLVAQHAEQPPHLVQRLAAGRPRSPRSRRRRRRGRARRRACAACAWTTMTLTSCATMSCSSWAMLVRVARRAARARASRLRSSSSACCSSRSLICCAPAHDPARDRPARRRRRAAPRAGSRRPRRSASAASMMTAPVHARDDQRQPTAGSRASARAAPT